MELLPVQLTPLIKPLMDTIESVCLIFFLIFIKISYKNEFKFIGKQFTDC